MPQSSMGFTDAAMPPSQPRRVVGFYVPKKDLPNPYGSSAVHLDPALWSPSSKGQNPAHRRAL